jgi:methyl-accepting chemotaxis protein
MASLMPKYHQKIMLLFSGFLFALFAFIGGLGGWGLSHVNSNRIERMMRSVRVMTQLNHLRTAFAKQHDAISYGLSKSTSAAQESYRTAQERIQECLTALNKDLTDRKDLVLLNNLTYNQTMFSEQIVRLFDYLYKRNTLSLTYDELTDLKSYPVQSLKQANAYAEQFQSSLTTLEEGTLSSFESELGFVVSIFRRGVFYLAAALAVILALLLIALTFYSAAAAKPFRKISESLRAMTESDFAVMPDYGVVEDENVRYVLKNIGAAVGHFRTFLNSVNDSIGALSSAVRTLPDSLRSVITNEETARQASEENRSLLLGYAQEFANAKFYFDRVSEASDKLIRERAALVQAITPAHGMLDKVIESNRALSDTLYRFNETAEKINMFALNITLEAARENESKGYGELASEIRGLISQGVETHKQIVTMMNSNLNSFTAVRSTLHGAERVFQEMEQLLHGIRSDNDQLEAIRKAGFETEAAVEANNVRIAEATAKTRDLLGRLESTGRTAMSALSRVESEVERFGSVKGSLAPEHRDDAVLNQ